MVWEDDMGVGGEGVGGSSGVPVVWRGVGEKVGGRGSGPVVWGDIVESVDHGSNFIVPACSVVGEGVGVSVVGGVIPVLSVVGEDDVVAGNSISVSVIPVLAVVGEDVAIGLVNGLGAGFKQFSCRLYPQVLEIL